MHWNGGGHLKWVWLYVGSLGNPPFQNTVHGPDNNIFHIPFTIQIKIILPTANKTIIQVLSDPLHSVSITVIKLKNKMDNTLYTLFSYRKSELWFMKALIELIKINVFYTLQINRASKNSTLLYTVNKHYTRTYAKIVEVFNFNLTVATNTVYM